MLFIFICILQAIGSVRASEGHSDAALHDVGADTSADIVERYSDWRCGQTQWKEPGQSYFSSCGTADGARPYEWDGKCFGYEHGCRKKDRVSLPSCPDPSEWPSGQTTAQREKTFFDQGDFGLVTYFRSQNRPMCKPRKSADGTVDPNGSWLNCTNNLAYCHGYNMYIDFREATNEPRGRLDENYLKPGWIGGNCDMSNEFAQQNGERGSLQSWWNELRNYKAVDEMPHCDVVVDKSTMFLKLDASVNMYHHYCDFINVWLTQHIWGRFDKDVSYFLWDVSHLPYGAWFEPTWEAFTDYTEMPRPSDYIGKVVCFKEVVFPVLARRVRSTLFYNMFLESGCHNSALFSTFRDVVLRRLNITLLEPGHGTTERPFRVTFSVRKGTRKVINDAQLIEIMNRTPGVQLTVQDYGAIKFVPNQVQLTATTDIFIGMHGAGLTHVMFLPNESLMWELHNCGDPRCYLDLTRLTQSTYMTWRADDPFSVANATAAEKFTDYILDPVAFENRFNQAIDALKRRRGLNGPKEDIVQVK